MASAVTAEILRELMHYDPITGIFTRKVRTAQRNKVGDRADFQGAGRLRCYRQIGFKDEKILAHRAAWLYVHGKWPENSIDHINGNKSDNRIGNLRDVAQYVNTENRHEAKSDSTSGVLGAHPHQGRWRSRIQARGKAHYLGVFDTAAEAHAAYVNAKRRLHEGCAI